MARRRGLGRVIGWVVVIAFLALTTAGLWLPPILIAAFEKDYHFPEVTIDATVLANGDLVLEETRTFDFRNGPFTYAYFNVVAPPDIEQPDGRVRDFSIHERLADGSEVPVKPDYAYHSIATDNFQAQWSYQANDEERAWVFRYRVACAGCARGSARPARSVSIRGLSRPRSSSIDRLVSGAATVRRSVPKECCRWSVASTSRSSDGEPSRSSDRRSPGAAAAVSRSRRPRCSTVSARSWTPPCWSRPRACASAAEVWAD